MENNNQHPDPNQRDIKDDENTQQRQPHPSPDDKGQQVKGSDADQDRSGKPALSSKDDAEQDDSGIDESGKTGISRSEGDQGEQPPFSS